MRWLEKNQQPGALGFARREQIFPVVQNGNSRQVVLSDAMMGSPARRVVEICKF